MKIFIELMGVILIIEEVYLLIRIKKIRKINFNLECRNYELCDQIEEIKAMKHDLCNIIQSMGGFIQTNDIDGLKDMYDSILKECTYIKSVENLQQLQIKNPAIFNLINNKYKLARTNNIKFYVEVNADTNRINLKNFELCRIIGILIDNAIEASKMCDEKIINIIFDYDRLNKRNIISVENSYSNKDIDINKIFENGYTSKKEKFTHGLGLWKARQIVNLHNNMNLYSTKGKFFTQKIEIYD